MSSPKKEEESFKNKTIREQIELFISKNESEQIFQNDCKAYIISQNLDNISEDDIDAYLLYLFKTEASIAKEDLKKRIEGTNKEEVNNNKSVEGDTVVCPTNKIEFPTISLSQRGKSKIQVNQSDKKKDKGKINSIQLSKEMNDQGKFNSKIIEKMNNFKKEFFNPKNSIATQTTPSKNPLYSSVHLTKSKLKERYEHEQEPYEQKEYIFEKKKYDIKDPQQRAEYIKYIKSDIKNFEQKKQQLKKDDKKDKEDPYEQLNQLMNKISSNKTKK